MLKTLDEIRKAEFITGQVINGVDNPNILSIDSTEPIKTDVDELKTEERKAEEKTVAPKEDKKEEEKKEEKEKKEEDPSKTEVKEEEKLLQKETGKGKPEVKDAIQKRIDELTKKRRTAERERDFEKAKRLELETKLAKVQATIPTTDKPKKEDFDDLDDYYEALTDWKIEQKLQVERAETQVDIAKKNEKQAYNETNKLLDTVIEHGEEIYKDFHETVFSDDLVISKEMVECVLLSDIADEIMYYFGKNPEVSAEIAEMSPLRIAKEVGKIEAGLMKEKENLKEKKPVPIKKVTMAPAPIQTVRTTGAIDKDPSQMSAKEYRAWRERKG